MLRTPRVDAHHELFSTFFMGGGGVTSTGSAPGASPEWRCSTTMLWVKVLSVWSRAAARRSDIDIKRPAIARASKRVPEACRDRGWPRNIPQRLGGTPPNAPEERSPAPPRARATERRRAAADRAGGYRAPSCRMRDHDDVGQALDDMVGAVRVVLWHLFIRVRRNGSVCMAVLQTFEPHIMRPDSRTGISLPRWRVGE